MRMAITQIFLRLAVAVMPFGMSTIVARPADGSRYVGPITPCVPQGQEQ
jgi:hypothetical protein